MLAARDLVGEEPFAVILPDDLIDSPEKPALRQMLDIFEQSGDPVIALLKVALSDISAYGVIRGERDRGNPRLHLLKELVEKPKQEDAPSDLAIMGRYVLTPDIFDDLAKTAHDKSGEIQLTNGMRELLKSRPFYALAAKGAPRPLRVETENRLDAGARFKIRFDLRLTRIFPRRA